MSKVVVSTTVTTTQLCENLIQLPAYMLNDIRIYVKHGLGKYNSQHCPGDDHRSTSCADLSATLTYINSVSYPMCAYTLLDQPR
eukprot:8502064-Ditylum_brightwellii.AAC.1